MPTPRSDESHDDFIDRCIPIVIDDGTAEDSDQAVAICNSIWDERELSVMRNFLFIKLEDLVDGKPFDGLVAGTFTDMNGRKFEFEEDELAEYVENTKSAITATTAESGDVVGLPIDAKGHEEGDGAGWIVGAELEDGIIRLTPKWTEIGVELIDKSIRRFFSATVDTVRKVIKGGTLTNWPATLDNQSGEVLLRPIELAHLEQAIFALDETSFDELMYRVRVTWYQQEDMRDGPESYPIEVYEDYIIIERSDGYFQVGYEVADDDAGEITFADQSEWLQVKKSWVELAREVGRSILSRFKSQEEGPIDKTKRTPSPDPKNDDGSEDIMTIKLDDLSAEDQESVVAQLAVKLGADPEADNKPEVGGIAELIEARADKRADEIVKETLEKAEADREISETVANLTGGDEENPNGIPVEADELKELLEGLTPEQRETLSGMLTKVRDEGVVEFTERGHRRKVDGQTELPDEMKAHLVKFLDEIEDGTVEAFFKLNASELGAMSDYNLSEYEDAKKVEKE